MSATLATAIAFNLICSGQTSIKYKIFDPPQNKSEFEITYRVDLSSKRYCFDRCTTTFTLKEITANTIVFVMEERDKLDDTITFVNRENGRYFDRTRSFISGDSVLVTISEGECRKVPFTGFPARKF